MARRTTKAAKAKTEVEEPEELEVEEAEEPEDLEVEESDEEEDEVEEFEDLEVEESDEEDEEEEAPKPKKKARKIPAKKPQAKKSVAPAFGTKELVAHVNEATDRNMDGRALRIVLRKLAGEDVIERTVGDDRGRYSFTGPSDPQVKAVVAAIKAGAADKKEKPAVKKTTTKKTTAKKTVGKKTAPKTTRKKKQEVEELED